MTNAHIEAVAAEANAISRIELDPIPTSSSKMIEMGAAARNQIMPQLSPSNRNGTNKNAKTTTHTVIAIFLAATEWDLAGCIVILSPNGVIIRQAYWTLAICVVGLDLGGQRGCYSKSKKYDWL